MNAACRIAILLLSLATLASTHAAAEEAVDYETHVQPILAKHCKKCHGPKEQESELRLDTPATILKGGDSGEPVFVRGDSKASHIITRITSDDPDEVMPPKGAELSKEEVDVLRRWIDAGAMLPGTAEQRLTTKHWSFQPVAKVTPPALKDPWIKNPVDAFILAKLQTKKLSPSPVADRVTLIRRLCLVLHGLPPTPDQVARFAGDKSPDAYDQLVERLLASPHYGERWGRHWLDVVRFGETHGFEMNRERPTAYHYRDYVIKSLNDDKPYDLFVKEQIAGDAFGADIGTGFLVAGPYDQVKSPDKNLTLMQRQDELADMINTTGTTFLGLSMGCARCHNHKFDPVLQRDYYAWSAVFAGVRHAERAIPDPSAPLRNEQITSIKKQIATLEQQLAPLRVEAKRIEANKLVKSSKRPAVSPLVNEERFTPVDASLVRFLVKATNTGSEPCIDELEVYDTDGRNVALATAGATATASGTLSGYAIHKLKHINDGRTGNDHSWISNTASKGWVQIALKKPAKIDRIVWGRDRKKRFADRLATDYLIEVATQPDRWSPVASSVGRQPFPNAKLSPDSFVALLPPAKARVARDLLSRHMQLNNDLKTLAATSTKAWIGTFAQPGATHRLYRGDPMAPREAVAPDALTVLGTLGLKMNEPEQQRRVKLAEWIARGDHPLTARVLVNRVWQYHFGVGIVDTPNDFGANGTTPSHPQMLDWLAGELVQRGWSIKHVHRLVLKSNTYQQSSKPRAGALAVDGDARLLWRFPPRRLEAEAIRDCILQVSGVLDKRVGGPGFSAFVIDNENVRHYHPKKMFGPADWRRMIYMTKVRQEQDAVFGAFDCPDGNQVMPKRSRSTTPLQALNLLNSKFMTQQAGIMADRLRREAGKDASRQVERAFTLFYNREPTATEIADATKLIVDHGLESFCRAMQNTNEFLFIF